MSLTNLTEPTAFSGPDSRFDRMRKRIGLFLGPAVFLLLLLAPLPLSTPAHRMAAIMTGVVIYWVTEPIPIAITALLGPVMAVVLGLGSSKDVLASFGDPLIFLFIGSFLIAQAMARHRLDRRMAIGFLSLRGVGESPYRILWVLGGFAALLSMWISNTAATAMLFPISLGILRAMQGEGEKALSPYETGMMLMIAFSASVGGIGTPIGTPPNLIGIALIQELTGRSIGFFEWMQMAVPIVVVMFLGLYLLLVYLHPPQQEVTGGVRQFIDAQRAHLGPWSRGEKNVLGVFLFAVFLWILPGLTEIFFGAESTLRAFVANRFPESVVAILAAALLFLLPGEGQERTLSWEDASAIDWGTLLLFGGGLAIGSLMFKTGLSEAIGKGLFSLFPFRSVWGITFFGILTAIFVSELASNTASANMVIPVVIAFALGAGVSPLPPALGATLGASYGFMLPVSTPPNAIVYSSGKIPLTQMIRTGVLFDILGAFLILLGLRILCPLLGLI